MKLGISFSGDGLGHTSRIYSLLKALQKNNEIIIWCPEKVHYFLKPLLKNKIKIYSLPLLSISKKDEKVQIFKTSILFLKTMFKKKKILESIKKNLIKHQIKGIISDYEPFLVLASKQLKIPTLLLNHQGILYKIPYYYHYSYWLAIIANFFMMPKANALIVSSFYNGDIGPLIRDEIKKLKINRKNFILVYVKSNIKEKIKNILKEVKSENFIFFPNSKKNFLEIFSQCKGVISSAGHQIISECLYLKKPLLVFPEYLQHEQFLNAIMLEKTGWGFFANRKKLKKSIYRFLSNIDNFPLKTKKSKHTFCFQDNRDKAINLINYFFSKKK